MTMVSWLRTKKVRKKLVHNSSFSLQPRGLLSFFFCTNKRKTETKRKFAGYVPEAKICTFFLKKKNSLRSNSFFFFTKKVTNFFTLLHSCRMYLEWMFTKRCFACFRKQFKENTHFNERSNVESRTFRPHLFWREMEEVVAALKTKSCLSEASSFCLAETAEGIAKKVQPVPFLCFVSFGQAKEMKSPRGLSEKSFIEQNVYTPPF